VSFNAARLKKARTAAGLTQEQLARLVGTTSRNIGRWENGEHTPRPGTVAELAAALQKDVGHFFTRNGASRK